MCSALNRGREARTGSRQRRIRRRSQPRFCSSPPPSFPSVLPLPPPHAPHPPVLPNNRNSTPLQGHLKIPRPPSRKRKSSATSPSRKIYKNKGRGRRGRRRRCRTLVQKRSFTRTRKKIPATSTSAKRKKQIPSRERRNFHLHFSLRHTKSSSFLLSLLSALLAKEVTAKKEGRKGGVRMRRTEAKKPKT